MSVPLELTDEPVECYQECAKMPDYETFENDGLESYTSISDKLKVGFVTNEVVPLDFAQNPKKFFESLIICDLKNAVSVTLETTLLEKRASTLVDTLENKIYNNTEFIADEKAQNSKIVSDNITIGDSVSLVPGTSILGRYALQFVGCLKNATSSSNWQKLNSECYPTATSLVKEAVRQGVVDFRIRDYSKYTKPTRDETIRKVTVNGTSGICSKNHKPADPTDEQLDKMKLIMEAQLSQQRELFKLEMAEFISKEREHKFELESQLVQLESKLQQLEKNRELEKSRLDGSLKGSTDSMKGIDLLTLICTQVTKETSKNLDDNLQKLFEKMESLGAELTSLKQKTNPTEDLIRRIIQEEMKNIPETSEGTRNVMDEEEEERIRQEEFERKLAEQTRANEEEFRAVQERRIRKNVNEYSHFDK